MKLTKTNIHNYLYQSYEAKIIYLENRYFGEEVTIVCEDNPEFYIAYKFLDCYKTDISHSIDYQKSKLYKNHIIKELPFYLVDWQIKIEDELYMLKLTAHPMYLEIWCKDLKIFKMKKDDCVFPIYEDSLFEK